MRRQVMAPWKRWHLREEVDEENEHSHEEDHCAQKPAQVHISP